MFILLDLCRYNIGGVLISWHSPAWFINTAQAVKRYTSNRENLALNYTILFLVFKTNELAKHDQINQTSLINEPVYLLVYISMEWLPERWPSHNESKWNPSLNTIVNRTENLKKQLLVWLPLLTPCLSCIFFFYRLWYNAHLSHTGEYIKDPQGLNYFISESEPFSLYWQVWRPGALIICLITLSTTLPVSAM